MLKKYRNLIDELSSHWDSENPVAPNRFTYNNLKHIYDTANKKCQSSDNYEITKLKLTNNESCVEYSVRVGENIISCPTYILSKI